MRGGEGGGVEGQRQEAAQVEREANASADYPSNLKRDILTRQINISYAKLNEEKLNLERIPGL